MTYGVVQLATLSHNIFQFSSPDDLAVEARVAD
jgi:hypothetical protein